MLLPDDAVEFCTSKVGRLHEAKLTFLLDSGFWYGYMSTLDQIWHFTKTILTRVFDDRGDTAVVQPFVGVA